MLPYDIFLEKIQKFGNIVFSFDPKLHWGNFSVFSTVSHDSQQIPICFYSLTLFPEFEDCLVISLLVNYLTLPWVMLEAMDTPPLSIPPGLSSSG